MKTQHIVIITGMSGSGKSTALRALEDIGFYCVDNMPVVLLPKFLKIQSESFKDISNVAMVMDLREKSFLDTYTKIFDHLEKGGYKIEILFLDATDDALIHRFSETRRAHPLAAQGSVMEGIILEREKLSALKQMAATVIDTTSCNVHQLKDSVQKYFMAPSSGPRMLTHVMSFGYRYGLPPDADIVLDVRFLKNPYFIENLKNFDGHHPSVKEYVLGWDDSQIFIRKLYELMDFLMPLYAKEGKTRLSIALGCTGGKHRSVVLANQLGSHLTENNYVVTINHRDVLKS